MKKIVLILSLCLLPFTGFAAQQDVIVALKDFSGGLNTKASPFILRPNQGSMFLNLRANDSFGGMSKRPVNIQYGSLGSFAVTGLHRYYQADTDKILIATGSTGIYYGTDSTGAFTKIGTGFSDGKWWQWVTYKDKAIGMNGTDDPQKWDGKTDSTANTTGNRTAGYLVADLGAPFAELLTGANLDASKYYQYKVAFYNGATYSYSNARSNVILTGGTVRDVTLTDIPLGPTGTTARYVYRTLDNATVAAAEANNTFYKIATISNNTATTVADAMDDTTASGDAAPTWATVSAGSNVTPPKGKYPLIHREKLFIAGNLTYPSDLYWSENFIPDFFSPTSFQPVRADDGDRITFIKEYLGILTIGKVNTIQKFYTDADETAWILSPPFSFVGCPAPYSAQTTPKGIFYLARDGIYTFTGQASQMVSDAVNAEIEDILASNIDKAVGFYFKGNYNLAYTSQSVGGTNNNRVLVYSFIRDSYALDTKYINVFSAFDASDDVGSLYHGSSKEDGYVYVDEGELKNISARTTTDFNLGTFDDARATGDTDNPTIEISWDLTIDEAVGTIDGHGYGASAIVDRPDTGGTWTSQIYQINASTLEQVRWNETLNASGDVTFQVRTAATSGGITGAVWSTAVTDPTGSDLTSVSANNFIQIRINLSTSVISVTPYVYTSDGYTWKLYYGQVGATKESDYLSKYQSGWINFGMDGYKKLITRVKVWYEGTNGTLTINYSNDKNNVSRSFTIDMSVDPSASSEDRYEGGGTYKVFTHKPSENTETDSGPTGEFWRFSISETGTSAWKVYAVEFILNPEEIY
jgi:hypothetical protein